MMQQRVVDAIMGSGVKQIAIVDDVFDPPELDDKDFGPLLDYLEDPSHEAVRAEIGLTDAQWEVAKVALKGSNYDDETLEFVVRALYTKYVETFDPKYDVGGRFTVAKGANLANVRPIISFLRQCRPAIELKQFGTAVGDISAADGELVVFVDLFLDAGIGADDNPTEADGANAIEKSLKRIAPLMKCNPSVILMSSHTGRPEAISYRTNIEGSRVYASRFTFIEKRKVIERNGRFEFKHEALDALLDVFQSYKFGRGLHAAFEAWTSSAKDALEQMSTEVCQLELRDIAYLVRFRLAEEGQSLSEYLEWLFAECLVDAVGKHFDKCERDAAFAYLTKEEAKKIGGAFDGPTEDVASLYHRVRIEDKRKVPREHFRLGDLYLKVGDGGRETVHAVMNPDCDLVLRPNGKRAAGSLLLMQGDLEDFTAPKTAVGDFILAKGNARNINWRYKDVSTHPFAGVMEKPGGIQDGYEYIGTLRPLYAQEIQANLLNQLGRVGVAVPPALAFPCILRMQYRKKGGTVEEIALNGAEGTYCYFVPARQSGKSGFAVFTHKFVRCFMDAVGKISSDSLDEKDVPALNKLLNDSSVQSKFVAATYSGVPVEDLICEGVAVTMKDKPASSGVWCWVTVAPRTKLEEQEGGLE